MIRAMDRVLMVVGLIVVVAVFALALTLFTKVQSPLPKMLGGETYQEGFLQEVLTPVIKAGDTLLVRHSRKCNISDQAIFIHTKHSLVKVTNGASDADIPNLTWETTSPWRSPGDCWIHNDEGHWENITSPDLTPGFWQYRAVEIPHGADGTIGASGLRLTETFRIVE